MSLKSSTLTVLLPDSRSKNYLFNFVDTPGHPCFLDEVTVGMRLADSVLLVVDCIEGVTLFVNRMVTEAIRARLPIVVMINKLDRLVLELKLPPADAYFKIKHTIDELNLIIKSYESVH
jgi:U5 small nuclear ribonucleoprotein component